MTRVLLISDNPVLGLIWKKSLEKEDFTVDLVSDGRKGIEAATIETPDVIIVDSLMPDIDGFEFCQTLKSVPVLQDIPGIIMVSNFNLLNEIARAKEMGADDYWIKYDINPKTLARKIRALAGEPEGPEIELERPLAVEQMLLDAGIVEEADVKKAQSLADRKKISIVDALMEGNAITGPARDYVKEILYKTDYVDLEKFSPQAEALKAIPDTVAADYKVFPLLLKKNNLLVAMANPGEVLDIDYLCKLTGCAVHACYAPKEKIERAVMQAYAGREFREEMCRIKEAEQADKKESFLDGRSLWEVINERPVVEFMDSIIFKAVEDRVSDIHIESTEANVIIRYRIDGILHDIQELPADMGKSLVARIKVMSGMNVVERRVPQDGRFNMTIQQRPIDFRVSTVPLIHGEKAVIRILMTEEGPAELSDLGMTPDVESIYRKMVSQPYGMVLITGPTGSGKTTTLYATLRFLLTPEKNILSIEDPVEYTINRVNQIQVNPKVDLTFSTILRHVLRQDPNIIMVGEIRDVETAELTAQAALTGHLVLGTLHTNDAPTGFVRLVDMGLPPFIVSSTVNGIVAQRLMRRICPHCKEEMRLTEEDRKRIPSRVDLSSLTLYKGKGCQFCRNTGYRGRIAIYEVLNASYDIRRNIVANIDLDELIRQARSEGMLSLREAAWNTAAAGISTLQEMWRVTVED
ncbi:MAG: ATPase, T2SS/T4P/T4SS family [Candidatus Xenobiia bacterium LiM19]